MTKLYLALLTLATAMCQAIPSIPDTAAVSQSRSQNIDDPNVELIYQFPSNIPTENSVLRSNGQMLFTCLTCNFISQLDPNLGPSQKRRTVYTFPSKVLNVLGIAELERDVFAVATAQSPINLKNFSTVPTPNGPPSIWTVDLRGYQAPTFDRSQVKAKEVLSHDSGVFWDGLTVVNAKRGLLAATDFAENNIWLLDIPNKNASILASAPGGGGQVTTCPNNLGRANGMKYRNGNLYFTSTDNGTFGYIPISSHGKATGPLQIAYQYNYPLDDFAFGPTGNVYLTTFDKPDGGIVKRNAGTKDGRGGSAQIVNYPSTNSVIPRAVKGNKCQLLFTALPRFTVAKVTLPGPC